VLQREDFNWTVDVDQALASLPAEEPADKALQGCLTAEPYACQDSFPLLLARLKIEAGRIFVNRLYTEGANQFLTYNFGTAFPEIPRRALAQEVAVELRVRGPVEFRSLPLDGKGTAAETLKVESDRDQVVTVRLGNHPTCGDDCRDTVSDFLFNFNLLNKPTFVGESQLPVPRHISQGPNFDGQCSPGKYTGGGS
jgi:hypothetical protein